MAAVLGGQPAQERRPPQRREAVALVERRQAAEARVDEDDPAAGLDGDVVDVEVAGGVADARDVEPIAALVELARPQDVLEAPELVERTHPQRLAVAPQAHAAVEGALEDRQRAVRAAAEEEQLADLVGREGQADVVVGQPAREVARTRHLDPRLFGAAISLMIVPTPRRVVALGVRPARPRAGRARRPGRPTRGTRAIRRPAVLGDHVASETASPSRSPDHRLGHAVQRDEPEVAPEGGGGLVVRLRLALELVEDLLDRLHQILDAIEDLLGLQSLHQRLPARAP